MKLSLNELEKNIVLNSVNKLVINKMDVMRELGQWKLRHDGDLLTFENEKEICNYIVSKLPSSVEIFFSDDKNRI